MRTLRTVAELRTALAGIRRSATTVGLVPTMGAFHEGHLSLMRRAREESGTVVVSLFVNPTQFDDQGDLQLYPRDEGRDAALASEVGVDLLFAPPVAEIYPPGFATRVSVGAVTEILEGAHRGQAHFDGVSTVVTKLLNLVRPDAAYFGQKDAQQTAVIRQLVRDLDLTVRIETCPTLREPDGLAMSSRNARLSPSDRPHAASLYRALSAAKQAIVDGELDATLICQAGRAALDEWVELDYLELVAPERFVPITQVEGDVLVVIAAHVGGVRLIDNLLIEAVPEVQNRTPFEPGSRVRRVVVGPGAASARSPAL